MNIVETNKTKIMALCKEYNVARLYVFGSVLTPKFNPKSDVDFIVNFKDINLWDYADNYFNLKNALETTVKRDVDLLEDEAVSNPYLRSSIDSTKQLVYGE